MKKVRVNNYGLIHVHPCCNDCDFSTSNRWDDIAKIRYELKQHTNKTGHTTKLELTKVTEYEKE